MKKIFAIIALFSLTLLTTSSFAQMEIDKGTKFVNLGIGVGGFGYGGIGFNAAADLGVAKNITAGVQAGYRSASIISGYNVNYLDLGVRGSYHFNELISIPETFDVYAGLTLTYVNVSTTYSTYGGSSSGIYFPLHLGGRYMFSEKLGGFAELGSAVQTLRAGVTFKL
ncbi:hypothetical protein [Fibrella aquatica]|jgi:hypothetical protein|uniref:hypothetical protein n=1 Tax=Fibrella aquatica TaxID=3242487 RepID=UPI00351FE4B5